MSTKGWIALGALLVVGVIAYLLTRGSAEEDIGRVGVSGSVAIKSVPLEVGRIRLTPDVGTEGPIAWGTIERGRFDIPRAEGPLPGRYRVAVFFGTPKSKEAQVAALKSLPRKAKRQSASPPRPVEIRWPGPVEISAAEARNKLNLELP
jgi:hypothetical protein